MPSSGDTIDIIDPVTRIETMELLSLCLDQNYFIFEGQFWKQRDMGNPLSPFLSEIFLSDFEQSFLLNPKSPFIKNIKFWCRYVDDVLSLWTGTERQFNNFFNFINSKIQFTMEIEQGKKK
jgi:hypothetical protein